MCIELKYITIGIVVVIQLDKNIIREGTITSIFKNGNINVQIGNNRHKLICKITAKEIIQIKEPNIKSNLIEQSKKYNYTIFLDLETSGFPRKGEPADFTKYNFARIVEIGYIIVDENNTIIKKYNKFIKPIDFKYNKLPCNDITPKMLEDGIVILEALYEFSQDIKLCNTLISHNINFDKNILLAECYRCDEQFGIRNHILNNMKYICTLQMARNKNYKSVNLISLHEQLYQNKIIPLHRALYDAELCYDIYKAMI